MTATVGTVRSLLGGLGGGRRFHPGLAGIVLGLATVALIERGALRRRTSDVHPVSPGSTFARPISVVIERHEDRDYHYGLLFRIPGKHEALRLTWFSTLDTRLCDRGPISRWQGYARRVDDETLVAVVFLPRSWLILQGFLPLCAGIDRHRPYPLHDQELLLRSFSLEAFGGSSSRRATPGSVNRSTPLPRVN